MVILHIEGSPYRFAVMPDGLVALTDSDVLKLVSGGIKIVPVSNDLFIKLHSGKRFTSFEDPPPM